MSNSIFGDEGTVAHALAKTAFDEKKPASAYVGRLIRCDDYEHASLAPSAAPRWMVCTGSHALETKVKFKPRTFSLQVDADMAANVQIYLDRMAAYAKAAGPQAEDQCEVEVPIDHLTGERGETGTADRLILDFERAEIHAADLKFGRGVEVFAEDNEQLLMYLSGSLVQYQEFAPPGGWKTFRGSIHQPRINAEHPYEHVWTLKELMAFEERCKAAAEEARQAKQDFDLLALEGPALAAWEDKHLHPGEKQCKFCEAKATCRKAEEMVTDTVVAEFVNLDEEPVVSSGQLTPIPSDTEKLSRLRAMTPFIRAWCDAVDAHIESEILNGRKFTDWKVVQGKRGNRRWTDAEEVEKLMKSMRMKHDEMYDYSVISPTVAEKKLAKTNPKRWKKLQAHISQAPGSPTVVPITDKRPALDIKPVEEEFEKLVDNTGDYVKPVEFKGPLEPPDNRKPEDLV